MGDDRLDAEDFARELLANERGAAQRQTDADREALDRSLRESRVQQMLDSADAKRRRFEGLT